MIQNNFEKWYKDYYKGMIDPEFDNCYTDLLECYTAAWFRALEVDTVLEELTRIGQEDGEYG